MGGIDLTIRELMELVGGMIKAYMNLSDGQIVLYSSGWKIPNDSRLYIVISYDSVSQQVLGVKSEFDPETKQETASVAAHERFTIDLMSHNWDALNRYPEILMAFSSQPAILLQEEKNIRIFREGRVLDLSAIEGSGALHRIQIPIIISNVQNKTMDAGYFDKFTTINIKTEE